MKITDIIAALNGFALCITIVDILVTANLYAHGMCSTQSCISSFQTCDKCLNLMDIAVFPVIFVSFS